MTPGETTPGGVMACGWVMTGSPREAGTADGLMSVQLQEAVNSRLEDIEEAVLKLVSAAVRADSHARRGTRVGRARLPGRRFAEGEHAEELGLVMGRWRGGESGARGRA